MGHSYREKGWIMSAHKVNKYVRDKVDAYTRDGGMLFVAALVFQMYSDDGRAIEIMSEWEALHRPGVYEILYRGSES